MAALHCWVLIGPANARKGSVIRALAGIGQARDCQISLQNGQWLHFQKATVASVNEMAQPDPEQWVNQIASANATGRINLLLSFRLNVAPGHDAEDYVRALAQHGAYLESIVTLGTTIPLWVPQYGAPYAGIPNSAQTPTSDSARLVRQFWGWA